MCPPYGDTYVAGMKRHLPTSTVAAALLAAALFASATGGAVAGSMITGKQIKDGSLTAKDIKVKSLSAGVFAPDAAAALTGPRGAQGTPGTPGAAGANGVTGYEVVTKYSPYYTTADDIAFYIYCPAGKVVLGGTVEIEGMSAASSFTVLRPSSANAWFAIGGGPAGPSRRLAASVTCAKVG